LGANAKVWQKDKISGADKITSHLSRSYASMSAI